MVKRLSLICLALAFCVGVGAQSLKQELKKNIHFSAGNLLAYPLPRQHTLTPAPEGRTAFYISHYGRHGSRQQTRMADFEYVIYILQKAERKGMLSPLGADVLNRVRAMRDDVGYRAGDLTRLGAYQHREIARRMVERFPSVFQPGTLVDARSSTTIRCVLSMNSALMQMMQQKPTLKFYQDASLADLYYLAVTDRDLQMRAATVENKDVYKAFCQKHARWQRVVEQLFSDADYVSTHVNGERLNYHLFRLASGLQNSELGTQVTLYDLFNDDEIYHNWLRENAFWYLSYAFTPLNGAEQPYLARHLLRRIITQADSCIALPHTSVHLRFGHDTMVLPLVCLLGLDGYDFSTDDLEQLEKHQWVNYRIFPMAGNVQFVFYRRDAQDSDVLFKVLLNENEATLPLQTDMAPYYHWKDFRDYYLPLLNTYGEQHDQ